MGGYYKHIWQWYSGEVDELKLDDKGMDDDGVNAGKTEVSRPQKTKTTKSKAMVDLPDDIEADLEPSEEDCESWDIVGELSNVIDQAEPPQPGPEPGPAGPPADVPAPPAEVLAAAPSALVPVDHSDEGRRPLARRRAGDDRLAWEGPWGAGNSILWISGQNRWQGRCKSHKSTPHAWCVRTFTAGNTPEENIAALHRCRHWLNQCSHFTTWYDHWSTPIDEVPPLEVLTAQKNVVPPPRFIEPDCPDAATAAMLRRF